MLYKLFPFLTWLPLAKRTWKDDLIAGITGTIIVIPQAVAFALIAGLPPEYGFYTAIVTPIIAGLFGSSYHLISGPTTAISIVVYATVSKFVDPVSDIEAYISLTLVLTFISGIMQFAMGLARLGKLVNFVSHSVIVGFTAGAGILIAFKQLPYIFGISVPRGSTFVDSLIYLFENLSQTNLYVLLVASATMLIALFVKYFLKPISKFYMLIAMVIGSLIALWIGGDFRGIETLGELPSQLPGFEVPDFTWERIGNLGSGALVLALLGLIEAVAISKAIALQSHQNISNNQEFIGQGLSNMVASFFSSYAGSGSFTRSGVNYQSGAKTPLAAIFAALFLMLVLLFFSKYAAFLPKAAMGAIIFLVGYNLIEFDHIKRAIKSSKRELLILSVTIIGTLFLELEYALIAGISTSLFFYLERTSNPNIAELGLNKQKRFINIIRENELKICPQLKIIRIDGSIYFGALENISSYFNKLYERNDFDHVLIIANGINFVDLAGAEWLLHEAQKWQSRNGGIYFAGLKLVGQGVLRKGGFTENIGKSHFFKDKNSAINHIFTKLNKDICKSCHVKAFDECTSGPM